MSNFLLVVERARADADPTVVGDDLLDQLAPPEDCGGMWGYADLVEILNDPDHPAHEERLEWLDLDSAAEFEPGRFDADAITKALSGLR
ncbi:IS1096 element passenger TnpR family protein [Kribbella solani]|uniref:IS1096 element passenger TnpR family protein n=2 Tax=Kribbella solani TaxID=236067 RepID=UPI0029B11C45|nr:hypothetical protein [Kribbella solani]MDX2968599.1 hypothetical protein [Kribbella solani]